MNTNHKFFRFILLLFISSLSLFACKSDHEDTIDEKEPEKVQEASLSRIEIIQLPDKTSYLLNEGLSLEGLKVKGFYQNGSSKEFTVGINNIVGFDSREPKKKQTLKVSFNGIDAEFIIMILPLEVKDGVIVKVVENWTRLEIPGQITSIGANAFAYSKIDTIVIPETVTSIGDRAFLRSTVSKIDFPSSLKILEKECFYDCKNLKEVDLSKTQIDQILSGTFAYSGITTINLPKNLRSIESQSFMSTSALKSMSLPEKLEKIGMESFRGSAIETIRMANNVKDIDDRAFYYCKDLKEVTTFSSMNVNENKVSGRMGNYCFEGCQNLLKLDIPYGITQIGQGVLTKTGKLNELILHQYIQEIAFSAFEYSSLQRVSMLAVTPPVAKLISGAWYGFPQSISSIEVPVESLEKYRSAQGWNQFNSVLIVK